MHLKAYIFEHYTTISQL